MPLRIAERIEILRSGYASALADPHDLFSARMMVHAAFGEWGVNTNEIASLLLPNRPPLTAQHFQMLDQLPLLLEAVRHENELDPLSICKMAHLLAI